jgi:hypothetical protein
VTLKTGTAFDLVKIYIFKLVQGEFMISMYCTHFSFEVTTLLTMPMRPLIAKSTGIHSPEYSPLHKSVRRTPFDAATEIFLSRNVHIQRKLFLTHDADRAIEVVNPSGKWFFEKE